MSEPGFQGDPYNKIFLGAIQEITSTGFGPVREETQEEIEQRREMIRLASNAVNKLAASQWFQKILRDHGAPAYLGEEVITIQGADSKL